MELPQLDPVARSGIVALSQSVPITSKNWAELLQRNTFCVQVDSELASVIFLKGKREFI